MASWNDAWSHLRWVYERTDRFYTLKAAEFYEELLPWFLGGLRLKVEQAIQRKEGR